jgi:phosphohistidine phosphatase
MAKQLWFLRHGEAEPHEARVDEERRLTPRGERQSSAAGEALAMLGLEFDACYASPRVRGLDTAKLACEHLGIDPEVHAPLSARFGAEDALELLAGQGEDARILLVGHEPDFSQTVYDLTGARADVKKGGIAAVRLTGSRDGELIVLLRPKEIEGLSG